MIKCVNPQCDNFKHELEDNIEVCPLCGKPTENIKTSMDKRRPLGIGISLAAVAAFFIVFFPSYGMAPFFIGIVTAGICVVASIIIRMPAAIITSLLCVAGIVGYLLMVGFSI